jgi:hypothetical protein
MYKLTCTYFNKRKLLNAMLIRSILELDLTQGIGVM